MIWEQDVRYIVMLANVVEMGKNKCAPYWYVQSTAVCSNRVPDGMFLFRLAYRPEGRNTTIETPQVTITSVKRDEDDPYDATILTTTLEVVHKATGEKRTVKHIQYKGWPDHVCGGTREGRWGGARTGLRRETCSLLNLHPQGVPATADKFLNLVDMVLEARRRLPKNRPYILVHCSAGIGRTGVLVLTLAMLDKLRHKVRRGKRSSH